MDGFTDDGAGHVAKLPGLKELKIKTGFGEKKLTAAGIKAIVDARLPAVFEFDKTLIDDALFEVLVAKGWLYGPTPPGAREKRPAKPADVKAINLDDSRVTDRGLKAVLTCTNATQLFLGRTGVTDETLKKLGGFKKLEYLSLEKDEGDRGRAGGGRRAADQARGGGGVRADRGFVQGVREDDGPRRTVVVGREDEGRSGWSTSPNCRS